MAKKVLAFYYSQSGQSRQILEQFTAPFKQRDWDLTICEVKPLSPFPFPWTSDSFFDAMPESVLSVPRPLEANKWPDFKYDLIVISYQPWFLSPSIPIHSLLQDPAFQQVVADTPVVTLIGARNMWLNAQEKVKLRLKEAGANLRGNIALVDRHHNLISVITILYWMMSGKKEKYLNLFPYPGVSDADIENCEKFGEICAEHLSDNRLNDLQNAFIEAGGVDVNTSLMFIEQRAGKLFNIWAKFIVKQKNRRAWLIVYKYYLLFALFIVAPIILLINGLLFQPFLGKAIQRKKSYFQQL
ncbi:MAG: hypothetical protein ABIV51_02600 [Saprospiraceae bacterium]